MSTPSVPPSREPRQDKTPPVPAQAPHAPAQSAKPAPADHWLSKVLRLFSRQHGAGAWRKLRWLLWRMAALLGACMLLLVVMVGMAGWYTSRSEFCSSCHIMEPYYQSWQKSVHKDVACIECHFPPGFGGKIRGKMLGLVQLAKYMTKSEGPRPTAEIPDESCLRSGCHETRLLTGRVDYKPNKQSSRIIPFDHTPHLGEMRRGKQLRCTSCHSQIVQGTHMTVTPTTCFLCHFKDGLFNEGLGACTRCHQIPDEKFDLGGGVMFSHDLAYEKGVDCINCHGDVIRGKGEVPRERCLSCHNREGDLKQINDHEFMHRKHVTEHKIDCLQCHLTIEHSLEPHKMEHAVNDCASCHPDHHHEQVEMLRGVGAKTLSGSPSMMLVTRAECRTCHREKQVSATGTVLWKGSTDVCAMCHDAADIGKLQAYHKQLRATLPELQSAILGLRQAVQSAALEAGEAATVATEIDSLQHDLSFLRAGNDIHNIHYASKLHQALVERILALSRKLHVTPPTINLPPPIKGPAEERASSHAAAPKKA